MRTTAIVLIHCLGLAAFPLLAEAPVLGGQIALVQPQGDLSGDKWFRGRAGGSAGLYELIDIRYGNALRPRLDVTLIGNGPVNIIDGGGNYHLFTENAKTRILALAVDYNFFFAGHHFEGPYSILGFGYSMLYFTGAELVPGGIGVPPDPWPASQHAHSLEYAAGMGWKFSPSLGSEFRYTQGNYRNMGTTYTIVKAPVLNLSLTLDF
jgi:hypothetical protein